VFTQFVVPARQFKERTGRELVYWGDYHLERETGHAAGDDESAFEDVVLNPAQRTEATQAVVQVFQLFEHQNDNFFGLTQEAVACGGFEQLRFPLGAQLWQRTGRLAEDADPLRRYWTVAALHYLLARRREVIAEFAADMTPQLMPALPYLGGAADREVPVAAADPAAEAIRFPALPADEATVEDIRSAIATMAGTIARSDTPCRHADAPGAVRPACVGSPGD
jgi:hypothetical protein